MSDTIKTIKFKNFHFQFLAKWLNSEPDLSKRRQLKRFAQLFTEHLKSYDTDRQEIIKKYADKDEKGEFVTEDNKYQFKNISKEDLEKFNKEMEDLMNEEVGIDILPSHESALLFAKSKLDNLNVDIDPNTQDGVVEDIAYGGVMEAFETCLASSSAS